MKKRALIFEKDMLYFYEKESTNFYENRSIKKEKAH